MKAPRPVSGGGVVKAIRLFLLLCVPALALVQKVDDFSTHFSGAPGDTSLLALRGDSLATAVSGLGFTKRLGPVELDDSAGMNGAAGANPVVSYSHGRTFTTAYVGWSDPQAYSNSPFNLPPADILVRNIRFDDSLAALDPLAAPLARQELPVPTPGVFYGGMAQNQRPPPAYLNFAADSASYAAYWTSLNLYGPLRRTSDEDSAGQQFVSHYPRYVEGASGHLVLPYYGTLGMGARPGSGANQVVLAYEVSVSPARAVIRWENLAAGTSFTDTIPGLVGGGPATANLMEDFAVAVDSGGNAMVMWRQDGNAGLVVAIYDSTRTRVLGPIDAGAVFGFSPPFGFVDLPAHTYRQYGVTALSRNTFLAVRSEAGRVTAAVHRYPSAGARQFVILTASGKNCSFPSVTASSRYALVTWYGNVHQDSQRVEGAVLFHDGLTLDTARQVGLSLSGEDVGFNVGAAWQSVHNWRVPVGAIDDSADLVVAWDNQFSAKLAAWKGVPAYYDTAFYTSVPVRLRSGAYAPDPALDSVQLRRVTWGPTTGVTLRVTLDDTDSFAAGTTAQNLSTPGAVTGAVRGPWAYYRYRVLLDARPDSNRVRPVLDSVEFEFNVQPRRPVVDSAGAPGSLDPVVAGANPSLISRRDSLALVVSAFDPDGDTALSFQVCRGAVCRQVSSSTPPVNGVYSARVVLPPFDTTRDSVRVTVRAADGTGWISAPETLLVDYGDLAPAVTAAIELPDGTSFAVALDTLIRLPARAPVRLALTTADGNDSLLHITGAENGIPAVDSLARRGLVRFTLLSDTGLLGVTYRVAVADADTAVEFRFTVDYVNYPPFLTAAIRHFRGGAQNGVYNPRLAPLVTERALADTVLTVHRLSGPVLIVVAADSIDPLLRVVVGINSLTVIDTTLSSGDSLFYALPVAGDDSLRISLVAADPESLSTWNFLVLPEATPVALDYTVHCGSWDADTLAASEPYSHGLSVIPSVACTLAVTLADSDAVPNDALVARWIVESRSDTCQFTTACFVADTVAIGTSLRRVFRAGAERIRFRVDDGWGAFFLDTLRLSFPLTLVDSNLDDTTGMNSPAALVLGSSVTRRLDTVIIENGGTIPLRVDSLRTGRDDSRWFRYDALWKDPTGGPRRFSVERNTDQWAGPVNISPGSPPDNRLILLFELFTDSLRGDGMVADTFSIWTNDPLQPLIQVPFRLTYFDLPTLTIFTERPPLLPKPAADSLAGPVLRNTTVLFAFSEPVRLATVDTSVIRIYSRLDSIVLGRERLIPSTAWPAAFNYALHRRSDGTIDNTLVDTVKFTPQYRSRGDSLKVQPPPGTFIQGDQIRVRVTNGIVDSAGNALDLRRLKIVAPPGTRDSVFRLEIDNTPLRVRSTEPAGGSVGFDPQDLIRVRFDAPLARNYVHPVTGAMVLSVDTTGLAAGANITVRVTSTLHGGQAWALRFLRLEEGDSTLVFQVTPAFSAADSVQVTVFSRVAGQGGNTLDGNGDGLQAFFYDALDSTDNYHFVFQVRREKFYPFPNPFHWGDADHVAKGTVTFKNLASLKGVHHGDRLEFRILDLAGQLLYTETAPLLSVGGEAPVWEWNLRNQAGERVATGVYIYSVLKRGKVLVKGKLGVVR